MAYSPRRVANKGVRAEKRLAQRLKCLALGGPGKPDIVCKGVGIENKHRDTRRIHAGFVKQAHKHGSRVLNASGRRGFTAGAKRLAKALGIRLTRKR